MKKIYLRLSFFLTFTLFFAGNVLAQYVFDGSESPFLAPQPYSEYSTDGNGADTMVVDDPEIPGNKLYSFHTATAPDNAVFRLNFDQKITKGTFVWRVKAQKDLNPDMVFGIDLRTGDYREVVRIFPGKIMLTKTGVEKSGYYLDNWRIFRLTYDLNATDGRYKVYVDENPVPFIVGDGETKSNTYFKWGDNSADNNAAFLLDWFVWDTAGTYAPGQGWTIPAELSTEVSKDPFVYDASTSPFLAPNPYDDWGQDADGADTMVVDDPDIPGNHLYYFNTKAPEDNFVFRLNFNDKITKGTFVWRVKAVDTLDRSMIFGIDLRTGDFREVMRIFPDKISMVKTGIEVPHYFQKGWKIYRLTYDLNATDGNRFKVYVDEQPMVVVASEGVEKSNKYFKWGDNSADNNAAFLLDWFMWDSTAAYAPGEGWDLPVALSREIDPAPYVYDASVIPEENNPAFEYTNVEGNGAIYAVVDDPENAGNKLLSYTATGVDDRGVYRIDFPDVVAKATFLFRISGQDNPDANMVMEMDLRTGEYRDVLRIFKDKLVFKESGTEVKIPYPNKWRIYRLVYDRDAVQKYRVYVDEKPNVVLASEQPEQKDNKYVKWGDNSDNTTAFTLDWMIWDINNAYAPGEGWEIPSSFVTDVYPDPQFNVYDASVMPTEAGYTVVDSSNAADDIVAEVIADTSITGNNLFHFLAPTEADELTYGVDFSPNGISKGTFVYRARGLPEDLNMYMTFDMRSGVKRDVVRMYNTRLKFDKSDNADIRNLEMDAWHVFRITFEADSFTMYLDENPDPLFSGQGETTADMLLKWGDGSDGKQAGFDLDWLVWDTSAVHMPGSYLPDSLSLAYDMSSNAYLSTIKVGGTDIPGFRPDSLTYDVELDSSLTTVPEITWEYENYFAKATLTGTGEIPSTSTIVVTAQDGTQVTYTLNFSTATGIGVLNDKGIRIYPNPVSDVLHVDVQDLNAMMNITITNMVGQSVMTLRTEDPHTTIDIRSLKRGMYFIRLKSDKFDTVSKLLRK